MVDTGYVTPTERISKNDVSNRIAKNVETATNMYPGRLVMEGSTGFDVVVSDTSQPIVGWLGHEGSDMDARKDAFSTILVADEEAIIYQGGNFDIWASLAAGFTVLAGDVAVSWSDGQVASAMEMDGRYYLRIPFSENASETDTGVDIPSGAFVSPRILLQVVSEIASGTIDVGILSSEGGGDADGFLDAQLTSAAGLIKTDPTITVGGSETYYSATLLGALLRIWLTGSNAAEDTGIYWEQYHVGDGTAESISYTTSAHASTGYILVPISAPGIQKVGKFPYALAKSASAQRIWVNSHI